MATSARDKLLAMILPALIVLVGYVLTYGSRQHKLLAKLNADVEQARGKQSTKAQIQMRQEKLVESQRELAEVQKAKNYADFSWNALAAPCLDATKRSDRLTRFLALLARKKPGSKSSIRDVEIRDCGLCKDAAKEVKLSAPLERFEKLMTERGNGQKPSLWRVHVKAEYDDMRQALHELCSGDLVAMPLAISMKRLPDDTRREWVLLVWI